MNISFCKEVMVSLTVHEYEQMCSAVHRHFPLDKGVGTITRQRSLKTDSLPEQTQITMLKHLNG